ncbi:kappaPI-actitoxin-Avd3d-like [Ornithodoros turicata]|uniref:kappaPI-actitoxin-Avd3d-like n=1 Tax=Ornithodoros turicata TaxID=34597 RepID=UPI00313A10D4
MKVAFVILLIFVVSCTGYDVCRLRYDPGPCKMYFPRYYYDLASRSCRQFIYSGCSGNRNNFRTLQECSNACRGVTARSLSDSEPVQREHRSMKTQRPRRSA